MRILVTGANGFVGRPLCAWLKECGYAVVAAVRTENASELTGFEGVSIISVGDIHSRTKWANALQGVDAVIHLAARVHVMNKAGAQDEESFLEVNARGTERLAREAASAGVRRLVFLSTIKVNGEQTHAEPFRETDVPAPQDAYGRSKWQAEQALRRVAEETGLEIVIVRPPLMYGPNVKGNFLSLLKAISSGLPLPLGCIHNRRSLLSVSHVCELLQLCATRSEAAGHLFLAADEPAVSSSSLARAMGAVLKRPARLIPVPVWLLKVIANLLGRGGHVQRLVGDLEIDASKAVRLLGWQNRTKLHESLISTAQWFAARSTKTEAH